MRLDVSLVPDTETISKARQAINDLAGSVANDPDGSWRLAMAAHELLDNARKFGLGGVASVYVDIKPTEHGHVARLCVRNRSEAEHIRALRALFESLQMSTDPWKFYLSALVRTARTHEGSGLGLARIWAEGEMALTMRIEAEDCVDIRVELHLVEPS